MGLGSAYNITKTKPVLRGDQRVSTWTDEYRKYQLLRMGALLGGKVDFDPVSETIFISTQNGGVGINSSFIPDRQLISHMQTLRKHFNGFNPPEKYQLLTDDVVNSQDPDAFYPEGKDPSLYVADLLNHFSASKADEYRKNMQVQLKAVAEYAHQTSWGNKYIAPALNDYNKNNQDMFGIQVERE